MKHFWLFCHILFAALLFSPGEATLLMSDGAWVLGESRVPTPANKAELGLTLEQKDFYPLVQMLGGTYKPGERVESYFQRIAGRMIAISDHPNHPYECALVNNVLPETWSLPGGKIAVHRGLLSYTHTEAELAAAIAREIVRSSAWEAPPLLDGRFLEWPDIELLMEIVPPHIIFDQDQHYRDVFATWYFSTLNPECEEYADYMGACYLVRAGYDPKAMIALKRRLAALAPGDNRYLQCCMPRNCILLTERLDKLEAFINTYLKFEGRQQHEPFKYLASDMEILNLYYAEAQQGYVKTDFGSNNAAVQIAKNLIYHRQNEAPFYGLLALAKMREGAFKDALIAFNQAIAIDPNYYDYYLQRSRLYKLCDMQEEQIKDEVEAYILFHGKVRR